MPFGWSEKLLILFSMWTIWWNQQHRSGPEKPKAGTRCGEGEAKRCKEYGVYREHFLEISSRYLAWHLLTLPSRRVNFMNFACLNPQLGAQEEVEP